QAMPEPDMASVLACRDELAATKPDLLVALGGGSSIDLAKMIAVLLTHGGHPSDYYGENKVPGKVMPIIAIPTTAGTGSEVSPVAIVTDDKLNMKVGLSDNQLRPAVALLDPELTLKLPPYITACTGMDALTQAIEACYGKDHRFVEADGDPIYQGSNPMSDLLAERAIALIAENLPVAVHQGSNLGARSNMLLGNILSALAFSNSGVSWVHAVAYPVAERAPRPAGKTGRPRDRRDVRHRRGDRPPLRRRRRLRGRGRAQRRARRRGRALDRPGRRHGAVLRGRRDLRRRGAQSRAGGAATLRHAGHRGQQRRTLGPRHRGRHHAGAMGPGVQHQR